MAKRAKDGIRGLPSIERQDWLNLETKNALRKSTFSQSWVTLKGMQIDVMYPDRRKKHYSGQLISFEEYKLNDSEQSYTMGFALTIDTAKNPVKLLADTNAAQVRWIRALHACCSVSNLVRRARRRSHCALLDRACTTRVPVLFSLSPFSSHTSPMLAPGYASPQPRLPFFP